MQADGDSYGKGGLEPDGREHRHTNEADDTAPSGQVLLYRYSA